MKNYTATIDGVTKSLLDWGFTEGQMQIANQAVDSVMLKSTLSQFALDDIFPLDAVIDIHRDDTRIFSGRCVPAASATLGKRTGTMRIDGAWAELESRQYLQPWTSVDGAVRTLTSFGRVSMHVDPSVWDSLNPKNWYVPTGTFIRQVMQWAIDKGAPLQIGTIDAGVSAPAESAQDIMDSEAIVRSLRWTPGAVCYFDYSTDPVTFHCRQPASLGGASLPFTGFTELPKIQRSWRQIVRAVYVTFRLVSQAETGFYVDDFATIQYPPAGPGVPLPGERGAVTFSFDDVDVLSFVSSGLPKAIFDAYNAMLWNVEGTLKGEDVPAAAALGQVLNITGSRAAFASMGTIIQRTTDDFKKGTRKLECGVPRSLTGRDLQTLLAPNRRRNPLSLHRGEHQGDGQGSSPNYGYDDQDQGQDEAGGRPPGSSLQTFEGTQNSGSGPVTKFFTGYLVVTG
ncbi:MAG TPA: hypothetical protein VK961_24770 [Chthoniobacter sp.]|nr:hypothetical protein [Chthoniobacter sp.]